MIKKIRKKLMLLFLSFTMLIFTAAMCVLICNTVQRVQNYEIAFIDNTADSIIALAQQTKDLSMLPLSEYNDKLHGFIFISDGIHSQSNSKNTDMTFQTVSDQIKSGKNILSMEATAPERGKNLSTSKSVCAIGDNNKNAFYGLYSTFYMNNAVCEMVLACPRSDFGTILQRNCLWYLAIWSCVGILMFFISHFLIGEAVRPIETAMKSQKDFIASASHELKSPLAVIQANAETLHIKEADSASAQKQSIILTECSRMSDLIHSLLLLAASDTGHWTMHMKKTNVDTLLIELWEEYIEAAQKKDLQLDLDIEDQYPLLLCDKDRIRQALGVLLDNAIFYSSPGFSIEAGAKVMDKSILFYVKDHGPGIADKDKEKVFLRFYSGDPARTDKNHYGLGLSVASEIIKLHHGNIKLKDTPGGGCTFTVQLPIDSAD